MKNVSSRTLTAPLILIYAFGTCLLVANAVEEVVDVPIILPEASSEVDAGTSSVSDTKASRSETQVNEAGLLGEDDVFILDDFTVSAEKDVGYYSANSLAASRTNQLIKDTPMVIDVLNEQLIEDLGLYGIEDISTLVAGVDRDDGVDFSNRRLVIRGLSTRFQFFEFFPRQLPTDSYNKDRVEVIRGPSSLVYGQSDPGGKTNSLAKAAEINTRRPTKGRVTVQVGDKGQLRGQFDLNQTINDDLAIRVMGFHTEREFDMDYRSDEKKGVTVETTFRPTSKTSIRLHLEGIEQELAQSTIFTDNTVGGNTTRRKSGTGVAPRNTFLADPGFVDFIPDGLMQDIYAYSADRTGVDSGTPDVQITSREDLKTFYRELGLTRDNNGSFGGPDVGRKHSGYFNFIDLKHSFSDNLHFKASFLREELSTDSITNGGNTIAYLSDTRLGDLDPTPPVSTSEVSSHNFFKNIAWRKGAPETTTNSLRTTLSTTVEHFLGKSQLIAGIDFDDREDAGTDERVWGITDLGSGDKGYVSTKSWIQSGNSANRLSDALNPPNGSGVYEFRPFSQDESQVESQGYWLAASNQHMDGRLWTMMGVRLDDVKIESKTRDGVDATGELETEWTGGTLKRDYVNPSIGALFWLTPNFAPFATYSQAVIAPSGSQRQPDGTPTEPEEGSGYDIGVKFDLLDGTLTGTAVYYKLEKENILVSPGTQVLESLFPIATNPDLYDTNGDRDFKGFSVPGRTVESEGVELSVYYNPRDTGWSFIGSYTYNESENTAFLGLPELVGDKQDGLSRNSFRLTASYAFKDGPLDGLRVGATAFYRTKRLFGTVYSFNEAPGNVDFQQDIGIDTDLDGLADGPLGERYEIWQDDLFQADVFISYQRKLGKGKTPMVWSTALRVKNITNEDAFASKRYQESREFVWTNSISF